MEPLKNYENQEKDNSTKINDEYINNNYEYKVKDVPKLNINLNQCKEIPNPIIPIANNRNFNNLYQPKVKYKKLLTEEKKTFVKNTSSSINSSKELSKAKKQKTLCNKTTSLNFERSINSDKEVNINIQNEENNLKDVSEIKQLYKTNIELPKIRINSRKEEVVNNNINTTTNNNIDKFKELIKKDEITDNTRKDIDNNNNEYNIELYNNIKMPYLRSKSIKNSDNQTSLQKIRSHSIKNSNKTSKNISINIQINNFGNTINNSSILNNIHLINFNQLDNRTPNQKECSIIHEENEDSKITNKINTFSSKIKITKEKKTYYVL